MVKISRNLKFFLMALVLSLPIFWKLNIAQRTLEDFLFWKGMADNPDILAAKVLPEIELEKLKPIRDFRIKEIEIEAKSAISLFVGRDNSERILFEKNSDQILPIASLTKLMTSVVVLENYDPSLLIEISDEVIKENGDGKLMEGDVFTAESLLYPLLMESSNAAAAALAKAIEENNFVNLMNLKAADLNLQNTFFVNPTGLDPKKYATINHSTAKDLVKLTRYTLETKPLIWHILSLSQIDLYGADKTFHHKVENNNKLLKEIPLVLGGKTGETPKAKRCLILVLETSYHRGYLINVILGSGGHFGEMKKLVNWINEAYKF